MHTHFSALNILSVFLGVLVAGTLFRLTTYHLIASENPTLSRIGQAMSFQY